MSIRMYWWDKANFGDQMSPFIVGAITKQETTHAPAFESGKLVALGSLWHEVRNGDTVWGTGIHPLHGRFSRGRKKPSAEVLAVRGPLTAGRLSLDAAVYGDPAELLPRIYNPGVKTKHSIGLVPHFRDLATAPQDQFIIDVRRPWQSVVDAICSCNLVVSSSLHGIIIAEAFGVPAVWSARNQSHRLKFDDYYALTARRPSPLPWADAIKKNPARIKYRADASRLDQLEESLRRFMAA